jgi:ketosteroid isomerase-like protein
MADGAAGDTEKAISALEMKWTQAERENKADLIAPLIADKYIATESEGSITNRAELLAEERATKYINSETSELKITVFGNTAIARYVLSQKGTVKGEAFDRRTRQTDTWVKMPSGVWQCVASHGSQLKS